MIGVHTKYVESFHDGRQLDHKILEMTKEIMVVGYIHTRLQLQARQNRRLARPKASSI